MKDNSKQEVTGREVPLGRNSGSRKQKEKEGTSQGGERRNFTVLEDKLQKWMVGSGVGWQRRR